jgi:hypothetical protein
MEVFVLRIGKGKEGITQRAQGRTKEGAEKNHARKGITPSAAGLVKPPCITVEFHADIR